MPDRSVAVVELTAKDDPSSTIDRLKKSGVDFIKIIIDPGFPGEDGKMIHSGLEREAAKNILNYAKTVGLKVIVHVKTTGDALFAASFQPHSLHHSPRSGPDANPNALDTLFDQMAANSILFVPSLAVLKTFFTSQEEITNLVAQEVVKHSLPKVIFDSVTGPPAKSPPPIAWHQIKNGPFSTVEKAFTNGVTIAAGSDCGNQANFHGYGLIQELLLLAEAGLPLPAVLSAATKNAALEIGKEKSLGQIKPGMIADIGFYSEDPLAKIENIKTMKNLLLGGKLHSRTRFSFADEYR